MMFANKLILYQKASKMAKDISSHPLEAVKTQAKALKQRIGEYKTDTTKDAKYSSYPPP